MMMKVSDSSNSLFQNLGWRVYRVPETATILFGYSITFMDALYLMTGVASSLVNSRVSNLLVSSVISSSRCLA